MQDRWMYRRGDEQKGRLSLAEVGELIGSGYLQPFDEICREGYSDWEPISSLQILPRSSDHPQCGRIEIGGLIFDDDSAPSHELSAPLSKKPSAYCLPVQRRLVLSTRKRNILIGIASIVLVSFGLVGAMVQHGLLGQNHRIATADATPSPTPALLPSVESAVVASSKKPAVAAVTKHSPSLAVPTTKTVTPIPKRDDSQSAEEFQRRIMGDWKGSSEGVSLTLCADRAILRTDEQFFQILPYSVNPSERTVLLKQAGGVTITLVLRADDRLASAHPTDSTGPLLLSRAHLNMR